MFSFVVRRLRWLTRVPLAPQIFDSFLVMTTALFNPGRMEAMESIIRVCNRLPAVKLANHRFGGVGFHIGGYELGHIHGNGLLDVLVGVANRKRLVHEQVAEPHHIYPRSGWVSYWVRDERDVERGLELVQIARGFRLGDKAD